MTSWKRRTRVPGPPDSSPERPWSAGRAAWFPPGTGPGEKSWSMGLASRRNHRFREWLPPPDACRTGWAPRFWPRNLGHHVPVVEGGPVRVFGVWLGAEHVYPFRVPVRVRLGKQVWCSWSVSSSSVSRHKDPSPAPPETAAASYIASRLSGTALVGGQIDIPFPQDVGPSACTSSLMG